MASNEPRLLYTITGTVPEMIRQSDGSYQPGYRVSFRTALGQDSYVIVPRSGQLEAETHSAVEAEARQLVNLHSRPTIPLHTG